MFSRRRKLKKEKSKNRFRVGFLALILIVSGVLLMDYSFLNLAFGEKVYLNPLARNRTSQTLKVETMLEKSKISFITVTQNSDGVLVIKLKDGGEVIFSPKKDFSNQISSLQLILSRLTIEGKKLKNLDFRYDNPVVSF